MRPVAPVDGFLELHQDRGQLCDTLPHGASAAAALLV
eukprot:CAMPEP_0115634552 /NCGR_PEP_ID=MMETSP0272-20121206/32644_1 /TAXON_ID=71861 /ORGANISM="Scrippsiella trochoidea, Strain CCMP3099" /LENGTH=36 /DNA_ID= /DNA_START= /DNA_END= /DNA_ORIENTATION=